MLNRYFSMDDLQYPFIASFAAQMGCISIARLAYQTGWSMIAVLVCASALGIALIAIPSLLFMGNINWTDPKVIGVIASAPIAATLFASLQTSIRDCPRTTERWWRQGSIGVIASLAAFPWV